MSQIVRSVNHWRVGMGVEAELERRDRKSVDRWLEQLRIEKLYEETMELYRRSCQPRRKERRGKDHRGEWSTESLDHQPGNLQCLKFAGRLLELRSQLDEEPPPAPVARTSDDPPTQLQEYDLYLQLVEMRKWAVRRGDVPAGGSEEYYVQRMLDELIGRKPHVSSVEAALCGGPSGRGQRSRGSANGSPPAAANAAPDITNISAAAPADESDAVAATACPATTSAAACDQPESGDDANNCEIFASDLPCTPRAYPSAAQGRRSSGAPWESGAIPNFNPERVADESPATRRQPLRGSRTQRSLR